MTVIRFRPRASAEPVSTEQVSEGSQVRLGRRGPRDDSAVVTRPTAEGHDASTSSTAARQRVSEPHGTAPMHDADEVTPPGGYLIESLAASLRTPEALHASDAAAAQGWVDEDTGRYTESQRAALRAAHPDAAPPPGPPARPPRPAKAAPAATEHRGKAALPPPPTQSTPRGALHRKAEQPPLPVRASRSAARTAAAAAAPLAAAPQAGTPASVAPAPPPLTVSLSTAPERTAGQRPLLIAAALLLVFGAAAYALSGQPEPVEPTASLIVQSTPPGAHAVLGGRDVGRTPLEMDGVAIGPAVLELHLPGHRKVRQELRLLAEERNVVNAFLTPLPPAPTATPTGAGAETAEAASRGPTRPRAKRARARPHRARKAHRSRARRLQKPRPKATPTPPTSADPVASPGASSGLEPTPPIPREEPSAAPVATREPAPPTPRASRRKPVRQSWPAYPSAARRKGTEGWVRVSLAIDAAGRVTDAKVVDADPPKLFDRAALDAVRTWRYEPLDHGAAPSPRQTVKVRFQLNQ